MIRKVWITTSFPYSPLTRCKVAALANRFVAIAIVVTAKIGLLSDTGKDVFIEAYVRLYE